MPDPRYFDEGGSINERLLDMAIRRAFRTQQFAKGEAEAIRRVLRKKVYPRLVERVAARLSAISARGYDVGPHNSKRTANMFASLDEIIVEEMRSLAKEAKSNMLALAKDESDWLLRSMAGAAPVEIGLGPPSPQTLRSIVQARPFQGRIMREWYGDLAADTQKRVRGAIREGMASGETIDQIVRRLRGTRPGGFQDGILNITTRQAENIARTATTHVAAHAREATYQANTSLLNGVQWVSTLDTRTCVVCGSLDGQLFPVGEGQRPTAHWSCRCTTIPVLKSWKELGVDVSEMSPGQRASFDGLVPGDLTYEDWLRKQSKQLQIEALGAGKAKLFAQGMSIGEFSTATLKPISLQQLQASD